MAATPTIIPNTSAANHRMHETLLLEKPPLCRACNYFGCGTSLRYGLGDFHPPGYFCCASSFDTEGRMITSSPCFQFTGVATLCLAVSCIESMTRRISSKLRPVLMG